MDFNTVINFEEYLPIMQSDTIEFSSLGSNVQEIAQPIIAQATAAEAPKQKLKRHKFTPKEDQIIREGRLQDRPENEIAAELGLNRRQVIYRWSVIRDKLPKLETDKKRTFEYNAKFSEPSKRISADIIDDIVARKVEGVSDKKVAAEFGLTAIQVRGWCQRNEDTDFSEITNHLKHSIFTLEHDQIIVQRIQEGKTFQEIAVELKVKSTQISHYWHWKLSKIYPDIKYSPNPDLIDEQMRVIVQRMQEGVGPLAISRELGITMQMVRYRWAKYQSANPAETN